MLSTPFRFGLRLVRLTGSVRLAGLATAGLLLAGVLGVFTPLEATARTADRDSAPTFSSTPGPIEPSVVAIVTDPRIAQGSGLALSSDGRLMFTMEDAGRADAVYGLDDKGKAPLTITLPKGSNEDWEDLATATLPSGRRAVFVADTGDAFFVRKAAHRPPRTEFKLIRFAEPSSTATGTVQATGLVTYRLRYADGLVHNAETLLVQPRTGKFFLVNKTEKESDRALLWTVTGSLHARSVNTLRSVESQVPVFRASGGAFSPTGDRFVIRNEDTAYVWWVRGGDVARSIAEKPIEVPLPSQRQGEGVAFSADGHSLLVDSEGAKQPIWEVRLPTKADAGGGIAPPAAQPADNDDSRTFMLIVVAAVASAFALTLILVNLRRRTR